MRNRFFVCFAFSIPLFLWMPMGLPIQTPPVPFGLRLDQWLFVSASGAVLWPSWPFFVAAWRALKNGILNMAVLVVLSVGTGYTFNVASTFFFDGGVQFYEAVSMPFVFILLGHWLEMRARAGANDAIHALLKLVPPMGRAVRDGKKLEIPTAELLAGDIVIVRSGDRIPGDRVITKGESQELTGDNRATAERVGRELGAARSSPKSFRGQKAEQVKALQAKGKWAWWATASTMPRPSRRRSSASPSARARMWQWKARTSCS
jgi:Cu2+-exporting ATPase